MMKLPIRVIASDDCLVVEGGVEFYPHKGQTVSLIGWFDMDALRLMYQLADLLERVTAADADVDEAVRLVEGSDPLMEAFIRALAERVISWTWTDRKGKSLPQPFGNPAAFGSLGLHELIYLALLSAPKLQKEDF